MSRVAVGWLGLRADFQVVLVEGLGWLWEREKGASLEGGWRVIGIYIQNNMASAT